MLSSSEMQPRLKLSYPCEWPYVVIGRSEEELRDAIRQIVSHRTHTITFSHASLSGRYVSLKVLVVVHSDEDRIGIFQAFHEHPATNVVI